MTRKFWIPALIIGMAVLVLLGFSLVRPLTAALASASLPAGQAASAPSVTGQYLWSYAAKYVCGYQGPVAATVPGEPVVKPGNYATEINIQNPNFKLNPLIKRFLVLVDGQAVYKEPNSVGPAGGAALELQGDYATMDDCNAIWSATHPAGTPIPTPMPLLIGYLVILSPLDINVNAVYTSNAPGTLDVAPTSNSIDVLLVPGKRVFLPAGVNP